MASRKKSIETLCDITYFRSLAYSQHNSPKIETISEIMFFRLPVCMYNSISNKIIFMKENSG
jgi:hypothetical protein